MTGWNLTYVNFYICIIYFQCTWKWSEIATRYTSTLLYAMKHMNWRDLKHKHHHKHCHHKHKHHAGQLLFAKFSEQKVPKLQEFESLIKYVHCNIVSVVCESKCVGVPYVGRFSISSNFSTAVRSGIILPHTFSPPPLSLYPPATAIMHLCNCGPTSNARLYCSTGPFRAYMMTIPSCFLSAQPCPVSP